MQVTFLDRHEVLRALREMALDLPRAYPELESVILFGSLARGEGVPGSDADLLLILDNCELPWMERLMRYAVSPVAGVAVEVFPYTRTEIERMEAEGNWFIRQALREGVVLFQRIPSPEGLVREGG